MSGSLLWLFSVFPASNKAAPSTLSTCSRIYALWPVLMAVLDVCLYRRDLPRTGSHWPSLSGGMIRLVQHSCLAVCRHCLIPLMTSTYVGCSGSNRDGQAHWEWHVFISVCIQYVQGQPRLSYRSPAFRLHRQHCTACEWGQVFSHPCFIEEESQFKIRRRCVSSHGTGRPTPSCLQMI